MPLDLTEGQGDSYISLADLANITSQYGLSLTGDETAQEQALRRAVLWLDGLDFIGTTKAGNARAWPRNGAYDEGGAAIEGVPDAIKTAQAFAAVQELEAPFSLSASATPSGAFERVKVGEIEVEYANPNASASVALTRAKAVLGPLLVGGASGAMGRTYR